MEQCKLCKLDIEGVRWIDDSKQIAMGRNADGVYELLTVEDGIYGSHRYVTELNFCPTCGRRLNEGLVEDVSIDAPKPIIKEVEVKNDYYAQKAKWANGLSDDLKEEYSQLTWKSMAEAMGGKPIIVRLKGSGVTQIEINESSWTIVSLDNFISNINDANGDIKIEKCDIEGWVDADIALKEFEIKHGFNKEE